MCIGQKARNLVQQREIVQEEEGVVPIKKLKTIPNGKVISTAMEEYIFPPTLYRDGGTSFLSRGCSHIYRNELAKSGDAVQYLSSQNEVAVGIFEEGLILKRKRNADVINAVKLQIIEKSELQQRLDVKLLN
uniref:Uncharacterized protein n=1 Tax=Magallana gigas TaxID=29159 RepID=A0A8W8MPN2_MAGGI|nr:uncharacterized protein LOC117685646 [Crassostrea gigas]